MNATPHDDDPQLRARFRALRAAEDAQVKDFTALLTSAPQRRSPSRGGLPRLAWACVAVLVGVVWLIRPAPLTPPPSAITNSAMPPAGPVTITQWRAPSDTLLQTADLQLWRDVPRLGAPLSDRSIPINEES